jgi:hypothetical protein
LRVAPAAARVLHGVVEGTAGVVEDLAHVDAAGDQVVAGGVDVVDGEDQAVRRAGLGRARMRLALSPAPTSISSGWPAFLREWKADAPRRRNVTATDELDDVIPTQHRRLLARRGSFQSGRG